MKSEKGVKGAKGDTTASREVGEGTLSPRLPRASTADSRPQRRRAASVGSPDSLPIGAAKPQEVIKRPTEKDIPAAGDLRLRFGGVGRPTPNMRGRETHAEHRPLVPAAPR